MLLEMARVLDSSPAATSSNVVAYEFTSKGFSRWDVQTNESKPKDSLAGQFMGLPLKSDDGFGVPAASYEFANTRLAWESIAPLLDRASPLRTSQSDSGKANGRGIAYAQRNGTRVAVVAEVEIDRQTGNVWARKLTVAHDCGQIINPDGLRHTIEGNIIQGISRAIWEEVRFDNRTVTSIDWMTYPILDITEAPESIDIVLINHPELPPTGSGEPAIRPVAAAIANAIFDATGVRLRRAPFTPDRVKGALS